MIRNPILQFDNDIWQAIRRRKSMKRHKHRHKQRIPIVPALTVSEPKYSRRYHVTHAWENVTHSNHRSNIEKIIHSTLLPRNLKYILSAQDCPFFISKIKNPAYITDGNIQIPSWFSIIDNASESYVVICQLLSALFILNLKEVQLDYSRCTHLDLTTQVLLDSILSDYIKFARAYNKNRNSNKTCFHTIIQGCHIDHEDIRKMIFSVGTPSVFELSDAHFDDVIPYHLCRHDALAGKNKWAQIERKDLDTTKLVEYVIACLSKVHKELTPEKLDALCTVIGEALINAEEHSTLRYRYSIGYFKDEVVNGKHEGVFRLVIMNFGKSIYEKFKDEKCPNPNMVNNMKALSKRYTSRQLFRTQFSEEELWTLYALQEGVTSVSPQVAHRGNGSIRFIDSFFMLKGSRDADNISKMTITSGRARIVFDGSYQMTNSKTPSGESCKTMTFNKSGSIEDKPDEKYVYQDEYYFPGTIISAKIMLNENDVTLINE